MRAQAHCEYDNGFLVFDRLGHAKEIWRLVCDAPEGETASHAPPGDKQTEYYEQAYARNPATVDNRGHFRPWALISYSEKTLAFRFVYPTLLTSGKHHMYLHDVRTGEQIRVLENAVLDSSPAWNMVTYLELSERHVFIARLGAGVLASGWVATLDSPQVGPGQLSSYHGRTKEVPLPPVFRCRSGSASLKAWKGQ